MAYVTWIYALVDACLLTCPPGKKRVRSLKRKRRKVRARRYIHSTVANTLLVLTHSIASKQDFSTRSHDHQPSPSADRQYRVTRAHRHSPYPDKSIQQSWPCRSFRHRYAKKGGSSDRGDEFKLLAVDDQSSTSSRVKLFLVKDSLSMEDRQHVSNTDKAILAAYLRLLSAGHGSNVTHQQEQTNASHRHAQYHPCLILPP